MSSITKVLFCTCNIILQFLLVSAFTQHRSSDNFEIDDAARAKLASIADTFNNGQEEKAREILENSDLNPKLKEMVGTALEVEEKTNNEDKEIPNEEGEKIENDEDNDISEVKDETEDKDEMDDTDEAERDEAKKEEIPIFKNGNQKQFNIGDLNTKETKRSFSSILDSVKTAAENLERAVKDGKVDIEKALQMTDLQNVISSFENA